MEGIREEYFNLCNGIEVGKYFVGLKNWKEVIVIVVLWLMKRIVQKRYKQRVYGFFYGFKCYGKKFGF